MDFNKAFDNIPLPLKRYLESHEISRDKARLLFNTVNNLWDHIAKMRLSECRKYLRSIGMSRIESFVAITIYYPIRFKMKNEQAK